jgi:bacteriocin-like protein
MTVKSEVPHLSPEELSHEELDAVSGGMNVLSLPLAAFSCRPGDGGGGGGQNDPAQMFQQILQQLTQGG